MEHEVAGAGPRLGHKRRRGLPRELPAGEVQAVANHLVGTEVHGEGKLVGRVGEEAVGVGGVLVFVRPTAGLLVGDGRAQLAVGRHGQLAHVAAHVVGHQGSLAGAVEADVAGRGPVGRLLV